MVTSGYSRYVTGVVSVGRFTVAFFLLLNDTFCDVSGRKYIFHLKLEIREIYYSW